MDEKKVNRNLLLIFRIVCASVGAAIGVLAIWQVFAANPNLVNNTGLRVVFYIACGAVPSALLLLTAKPLLLAVLVFSDRMKSALKDVKASYVACLVIGLAIGLMVGIGCEYLMRLFLNIAAIRIMLDVIISALVTYFAIMLFLHFVEKAEIAQTDSAQQEEEQLNYTGESGYLLSGSSFSSDRIVTLCEKWLSGDIFVLSATVNGFIENESLSQEATDALSRFKALEEKGKIKVVSAKSDDEGELASFAVSKNLKILVENANSLKEISPTALFLSLDEL